MIIADVNHYAIVAAIFLTCMRSFALLAQILITLSQMPPAYQLVRVGIIYNLFIIMQSFVNLLVLLDYMKSYMILGKVVWLHVLITIMEYKIQ